MEDLNNRQIVLLTMFTSFVVAIATGIITVAMLQEAPPTLTETVNRVVERTIERVVTGTSTPEKNPQPMSTVSKEVTVYTKEDDLVVAAVEKNQSRIAQIYFGTPTASSTDPDAIGFVISRDGLIIANTKSLLTETGIPQSYTIIVAGKSYLAKPMTGQEGGKNSVYFLKLSNMPTTDALDAVTFGRVVNPKLAQTVVVLGGSDGSVVTKTALSRLHPLKGDTTSTSTTHTVNAFEMSPKLIDQNAGGLVVNLDGQTVGIIIRTEDVEKYLVYPASRILELVGAVGAPQAGAGSEKASALVSSEKNIAGVGAQ